MKKHILVATLLPVIFSLLIAQNANAQNPKGSGVISIKENFQQQSNFVKWYYDSSYYEAARKTKKYECIQIFYNSDTATVEAWLYKPKKVTTKKFPLVIYNRGGMGNFGNLEETNLVDFFKIAENGYVVLASKTRFSGINGKFDQHGGVDVDDIVNLKSIYENLSYIDTANVFMYGFSRGGQNTYQASGRMNLNAMVVTAGTTDWLSRINERREFVDGWTDEDSSMNYLGFAKVFPNWQTDSVQILKDRSAIYWAEQIKVPVLILQSRQDNKVPCYNALEMAARLQEYNKEYSLIIYDEPSHSLPFKYFDSYDQMFNWFNKRKKNR
jgi:dipeptidyl aminopeptidase/acylaminoacyl peptidase